MSRLGIFASAISGNLGPVPPVSNPSLWLDANDATSFTYSSSNVISSWKDLSGNNRNFTQSTVASQPTRQTNVINSKPVVRFDGVNDALGTTDWVASNRTYFWVFRTPSSIAGGGSGSIALLAGANVFPIMVFGLGSQTGSISGEVISILGVSTGGAQIRGRYTTSTIAAGNYQMNITTDSSYASALRFNKTATSTTASPNGDLNVQTYPGNVAYAAGNDGLTWDAAEILIYDRVLSGSEITTVESYFTTKWGV